MILGKLFNFSEATFPCILGWRSMGLLWRVEAIKISSWVAGKHRVLHRLWLSFVNDILTWCLLSSISSSKPYFNNGLCPPSKVYCSHKTTLSSLISEYLLYLFCFHILYFSHPDFHRFIYFLPFVIMNPSNRVMVSFRYLLGQNTGQMVCDRLGELSRNYLKL